MKSIKQFRKEPYGLFLDLDDAPAAVAIDPSSGVILLNEGEGDDRFQGAVIFPTDFVSFEVRGSNKNEAELILTYGAHSRHPLGNTVDVAAASKWTQEADRAIRNHAVIKETPVLRQMGKIQH